MNKQQEYKAGDILADKHGKAEWVVDRPLMVNSTITDYICKKPYYGNANSEHISLPYDKAHKDFRLWTLDDAKPGDLLASTPEYRFNHPFMMIYRSKIRNSPISYCYRTCTGKFYPVSEHHGGEGLRPATMKEREEFFQTMDEAGYTWNSGKKELHKKPESALKRGDTYFIVKNSGDFEYYATSQTWQGTYDDIILHSMGMCFRKQDEAEALAHKLTLEITKILNEQKN